LILGENLAPDGAEALDGEIEKPDNFRTASLLRKDKKPSVNNRSTYRNHSRLLNEDEARELIRRHQANDNQATTELLNRFHRMILKRVKPFVPTKRIKVAEKCAGSYQDYPEHEDLVAAGDMGLLKAIKSVDLSRPFRLGAFIKLAKKYVSGAISDEAQRYRLGDTQHRMTRLERYVASHPNDKPEWIRSHLSSRGEEHSIEAIKAAQHSLSSRPAYGGYHTTLEGGNHLDYDLEWSTKAPVKPAASHDIHLAYDVYNARQLTPHMSRHKAISRLIDGMARAAEKEALRNQAAEDAPASTVAASTYSTSVNSAYNSSLPVDWDKDTPFWPEGSKWHRRPDEQTSDIKPKLRLIQGDKNGEFNQPGTLDHVVRGGAVHQPNGSDCRGIRQGYRATGQSSTG
jgi:hypothetical protein